MNMYQVVDLPPLVNSSGSSVVTAGIGGLHDADSLVLYLSTGTNVLASACSIEVSQFDPAEGFSTELGRVHSSAWYPLIIVGSSLFLTSGSGAFLVQPVGFRGIRIRTSANTITTGTTIAFATKQIVT